MMKIKSNLKNRNNLIFSCILFFSASIGLLFNYFKLSLEATASNFIYLVQANDTLKILEATTENFTANFSVIREIDLENVVWADASFYSSNNKEALDNATIQAFSKLTDGEKVTLNFYFIKFEGQWLISNLKIKKQ